MKIEQKEKLKLLEDELFSSKTELDILKKEMTEKTNELSIETAKLDQTIKNDLVVTVIAQNGESGEPTTLTTTIPKGTTRNQRFALGNDLQVFDRVIDAYVTPGTNLTRINNGPILWDIYDLITIETTP